MSILSSIIGSGIAAPVNAVANVISKLYTTDGEKLDKQAILEKLSQVPDLAQVELNKAEAQHKSMFVAGWRPWFGWGIGSMVMLGALMEVFIRPILACFNILMPPIPLDFLITMMGGILGLSGWRTLDKIRGTTYTFGDLPEPRSTKSILRGNAAPYERAEDRLL